MKVLLDHNVPHKLRGFLADHAVSTADEMGWSALGNGELLSATEKEGLEVMVTGDKNMSYQQNLKGRKLAVVVLATNRWKVLKEYPGPVLAAVNGATPGSFQMLTFPVTPTA